MKGVWKIICAIVLSSFGVLFLTASVVNAASCEGVNTAIIECGDNESGIGHILGLVVGIMSVLVGILGVIGITVVGIQYLTARGNEEQTRKAKRRMLEIVIGLIAYVLIAALIGWLMPGGLFNPEDIPHYEKPDVPESESVPTPTPTPTPSDDTGGMEECKAVSGATGEYSFSYNLYVPGDVKRGMPLLLYMHGGGGTGDFNVFKLGNQTGFITVAPIKYPSDWVGFQSFNGGVIIDSGIVKEVMSLVKNVATKCKVNTNKIYIMGPSNGAVGVWYTVYNYPSYFAVAVPIDGYEGPGNNKLPGFDYVRDGNLKNLTSTKIVGITGTVASYTQPMTNLVNAINSNGGKAKLIVINGATHDTINSDINTQLFGWLIQQSKGSGGFKNTNVIFYTNKSDLVNTLNNL